MRTRLIAAVGLLALTVVVLRAHDPITTKVTWSREIVRIVNNRCAGCHTKDGTGLFPLTTYEETKSWAKAIKDEVVSRRMPPWPAARGFGEFSNDPTLSPFEISLVAAWVDGGAPKGEAKDLPTVATTPESLAHPELVLKFPMRESAPSGESRTVKVAVPDDRGHWILGWQFLPNDPAIVSAEFTLDETNEPLDTWTAPERAVWFPSGAGQVLPNRQSIRATIAYRTARQQQDFPVGLPKQPPELRLALTNATPNRWVRHWKGRCDEAVSYTSVDAAASSEKRVVFSTRFTDAVPGSAVGLVASSKGSGSAPLVWVRSFQSAYSPTYRFSALVDDQAWGMAARSQTAGGGCRVVASYLTTKAR